MKINNKILFILSLLGIFLVAVFAVVLSANPKEVSAVVPSCLDTDNGDFPDVAGHTYSHWVSDHWTVHLKDVCDTYANCGVSGGNGSNDFNCLRERYCEFGEIKTAKYLCNPGNCKYDSARDASYCDGLTIPTNLE